MLGGDLEGGTGSRTVAAQGAPLFWADLGIAKAVLGRCSWGGMLGQVGGCWGDAGLLRACRGCWRDAGGCWGHVGVVQEDAEAMQG